MFRIMGFSVFLLLALTVSSPAWGQVSRVPRYRPPAGATMPRALDYFRRDVGVLDQYNTFVAPHRQLDRNLQNLRAQEDYNARRTQQGLSQLDSQIRQSSAAPTGTGATFMNFSHYYSTGNRAARAPRGG